MGILRNLGWFFFCVGLMVLGGHFLPTWLKITPVLPFDSIPHQKQDSPATDTAKIKEIDPAKLRELQIDTLQSTLNVYRIDKAIAARKNRKGRSQRWILGHGIALPVYVLRATRFLEKQGCEILRVREGNGSFPEADLRFACNPDTTEVKIIVGKSFPKAVSSTALVFTVDSFSIDALKLLKDLKIPYALAVNPFDTNRQLFYDLHRLGKMETLLHVPMEALNYPFVNPGSNALYIHQTSEQSEELLDKARRRLPGAKGLLPALGSRALAHGPLMRTVIRWSAREHLLYLEPPAVLHPVSPELCREYKVKCKILLAPRDGQKTDSYLANMIHRAQKNGRSVAFLSLTPSHVRSAGRVLSKSVLQGVKIVGITELMSSND